MNLAETWELLRDTAKEWWDDNAPRLGASLAFYTLLSLAPLLVVVTAIAGLTFGKEAAEGQLVAQLRDLVGPQGAQAIQTLLVNAQEPTTGVLATLVSLVMLLLGATGVFSELQDALNIVWEVEAQRPSGLWAAIRDRFLSFVMVLAIGFLLLVSLVASAALTALGNYAGGLLPDSGRWLRVADFGVSFAVITLLFALLYKVLPDAKVAWRDVWVGAAVTALLFTVGKFLIGLYLGSSSIGSAYGAAGSLAVFLVWVYYSAQILFLGAEFTQVYAQRHGRPIVPKGNAVARTGVVGRISNPSRLHARTD
ncbi:MAG: YihY/virulence factor BrkB family protein [Planctomycetes bacterium]|nr:YihY/virulence factor BrkB family protein [Planctomycetota bacterium]